MHSLKREGRTIRIRWSDDHESVYDIAYLRKKCPCALCRGHLPFNYREKLDLPSFQEGPPLEILRCEPVGRYALQFAFSDGHDTGIYTFEHLKKICPCPRCSAT